MLIPLRRATMERTISAMYDCNTINTIPNANRVTKNEGWINFFNGI